MTSITILTTSNNYIGFVCDGHAGFDDYGKDIVCAAISVLAINTINSIDTLAGDRMDVESNEDDGMLSCRFIEPIQRVSDEAVLLLKSFVLGVNSIYEQYGDEFLNIKFEEVKPC